jgi:brefeldin A-inhibited guanine nucleotide-exchange protein
VFLNEIYLALLERRNAPVAQKLYFMGILQRFCADPRALVETYLNYDCDRNSVDNMFQTLIEDLSRAASSPVLITPFHQQQYEEKAAKSGSNGSEWQSRGTLPPPLSTVHMNDRHTTIDDEVPKEYIIKRQALDALVETLRSLVNWSQQGIAEVSGNLETDTRASEDFRESIDPSANDSSSKITNGDTPTHPSTPLLDDDPEQLEKEKQRKTAQSNAIKQFNFKPKRGIKLLLEEGFIPHSTPEEIALFLLREEKLDKAQIGEFLGEGDEWNISIMHAFVDAMDFTKRRFVDALRQFLQSFRLPGEAQKIDRFMLKFANRYVMQNPNAFANADTAYVLSYSVVMLNTDQHSSKVVKRMTKEDFIKNNRGINDNADLPDEYLIGIYDEIRKEEIVLKSEREAAAANGVPQSTGGIASGLGQALATVGRDLQREAYLQQSEQISHRSEQLFKNLFRNQRKNASKAGAIKFIPATSFKHVGPMFDVTWMSFFSGLSGQMQNAHNVEIIKLCMEGMKLAVRIACLFDLETPREAFVSALKNATNLNNPTEMQAKNVEALKVLIDIGQTEGNLLKSSWRDILMCISQLDRLQLISDGVDESSIPDVSKARIVAPSRPDTASSRKSSQSQRPSRPRPRSTTSSTSYSMEIAMESRSDEVIKGVDRIFTNTANLSGEAIVYFVRALTEVSWEEIKISGQNESPRTYSLQKLVEISYYNMTRVRFEWTNIWVVLGEHFNRVGCYNNTAVVFFAMDS